MLAVTPLLRESGARWTLRLAVTLVPLLVLARVCPCAGTQTCGRLRTARNGRVQDLIAAVAPKLVERYPVANGAVATVTRLLASAWWKTGLKNENIKLTDSAVTYAVRIQAACRTRADKGARSRCSRSGCTCVCRRPSSCCSGGRTWRRRRAWIARSTGPTGP